VQGVQVGKGKGKDRAGNEDTGRGRDKDEDGGEDMGIASIYSSMSTNNCVRRKGKETEWWEGKPSYIYNFSFHDDTLN
jgi:hypothetical protein